jgi:hypothetical protein
MPPRRARLTIRDLMIAILVVAILLSLPLSGLVFLLLTFYPATLAIMILIGAGGAPSGRRIEDMYWGMTLYPLVFLGALAFCGFALMFAVCLAVGSVD